MAYKGNKKGLHIRGGESINDQAVWEAWDGETRLGSAVGPMSLLMIGTFLDHLELKKAGNPGLSWFVEESEHDE